MPQSTRLATNRHPPSHRNASAWNARGQRDTMPAKGEMAAAEANGETDSTAAEVEPQTGQEFDAPAEA